MGAGLSGPEILIIALIALGVYVGGEAVKGVKWAGHKAKCGIVRVVGKHCDDPKEKD